MFKVPLTDLALFLSLFWKLLIIFSQMKKIILLFAFLTSLLANAQDTENIIYDIVDKSASFVGGNKEFIKFISDNFRYSKKISQTYTGGKIYVKFVIEKDGSINQDCVKVVKSFGEELNTEVIRVMRISPNWIPAMHNNKPVRQRQRIPIYIGIKK